VVVVLVAVAVVIGVMAFSISPQSSCPNIIGGVTFECPFLNTLTSYPHTAHAFTFNMTPFSSWFVGTVFLEHLDCSDYKIQLHSSSVLTITIRY
jgi:hypothetical protein